MKMIPSKILYPFLFLALYGCVGPETYIANFTVVDDNSISYGGSGKVLAPATITYTVEVWRTDPAMEEGDTAAVATAVGESVTFTVEDTSGGSTNSTVSVTDSTGKASLTVYTGEQDGIINVTALPEHAQNAANAPTINVFMETELVTLSSSDVEETSSTTVDATVTSLNGTPVSGATVYFLVNSSPGTGAVVSPIAQTDLSGIAQATVVLPATTGAVVIQAATDHSQAGITSFSITESEESTIEILGSEEDLVFD